MTVKLLPKAIFDTLDYINHEPPQCVQDYLQSLGIEQCQREYALAREFLRNYTGSADTYTAYRREVERYLHWSWLIMRRPMAEIDRNHVREYLKFVNKPPVTWIALKNHPRFINTADGDKTHNLEWRPFVIRISKAQRASGVEPKKANYQISSKSLQALFACLSTFYTYLQQEEYLSVNPIQLIRQKNRYLQKAQQTKVTRKLSSLQWQFVIDTAEQLANSDPEHERTLFLLSAFYLLGLRISELSETPGRIPKMSSFAPDKNGLWWFSTVGKGNKYRDIAVPDQMLAALKRYRISLGLSQLPSRGEDTPLIHKRRGHHGLGPRQVRNIVQWCFDIAEQKLMARGEQEAAEDLKVATVHWLRHTAISADIEFRPREHVRDDAGHENPATTERYIDADRVARHQSARLKKLRPENKVKEQS